MSDCGLQTCNRAIVLSLVAILVTAQQLPAVAGASVRLLCASERYATPVPLDIDLKGKIAIFNNTKTYEIVSRTDAQVTLFSHFATAGGEIVVLDLATGDTRGVMIGYMKSADDPIWKLEAYDKYSLGTCRKSIVE